MKVLSRQLPARTKRRWSGRSAPATRGSARVRISYLLGNLTKSFNYRAVASNDEKSLVLSQYMRLQNFANEEFGSTSLWAGFGQRFLKPIGLNETKEMLVEKFEKVPIQKTYTCNPSGVRLPRPSRRRSSACRCTTC